MHFSAAATLCDLGPDLGRLSYTYRAYLDDRFSLLASAPYNGCYNLIAATKPCCLRVAQQLAQVPSDILTLPPAGGGGQILLSWGNRATLSTVNVVLHLRVGSLAGGLLVYGDATGRPLLRKIIHRY